MELQFLIGRREAIEVQILHKFVNDGMILSLIIDNKGLEEGHVKWIRIFDNPRIFQENLIQETAAYFSQAIWISQNALVSFFR